MIKIVKNGKNDQTVQKWQNDPNGKKDQNSKKLEK